MKKQIKRLSPHQNGKVFGVLFAVASLPFLVAMFVAIYFSVPAVDQHGSPIMVPYFVLALFTIFYLVFGYIFTVIGCAIYNFLVRYVGGFEFEMVDKNP